MCASSWAATLLLEWSHITFLQAGLLERIMFSALLSQYGLLILGLFIVLESAGLPLPGETMLLLAAAAAAQGLLPIGAVIAVAAGAAIVGDSLATR